MSIKILLVGGGTGGPVRPLLAVAAEISAMRPEAEFMLVGTRKGPERAMAEHAGIPFASIPAGKFRRYFSLANFMAPLLVLAGFVKSFLLLKKHRFQVVLGAGGFVQVPLVAAAWFLGIPVVIHQQDVVPGLANRLSQFFASKITVTFEESAYHFHQSLGILLKKPAEDKIVWTGNPFTEHWAGKTREQGIKAFSLKNNFPTLFVFGGGTGSKFINELIKASLPELTRYVQVIHSTGHGKNLYKPQENYVPREFITNMDEAYAAADIVIARAGMSTITELAHLEKAAIVIPLPNSPRNQEPNAWMLYKKKAALVADETQLTPELLVKVIRKLLFDHETQKKLQKNISEIMPGNAAAKIATIVVEMAKAKNHRD
jgi:UDP-N-acetylglucosamine--N-acetylmuramyl-(pentapeptide) pyrophosphoryl-undecaprenol N-acetylglucosamine transferase